MKREDFIHTIGFQGGIAIVDGQSKRKYGKLSLEELLEKKLFNPAFRLAVYENDGDAMEKVAEAYRRESGDAGVTIEKLKRLFGVYEAPEQNRKVQVL